MRTVLQRVQRASVQVGGEVVGAIDQGVLLLVGVQVGDGPEESDLTARKIAALRIFPGRTPMDRTLTDVGGGCLVVSQFTLLGQVRKGNRPSFTEAETPERAEALYLRVAEGLRERGLRVATGRFGADMAVELVNDGPVTLVVEARDGRLL